MALDHCYDDPDRFIGKIRLDSQKLKNIHYVGNNIQSYLNTVPFETMAEWTLSNDKIEIVFDETHYRIQRSFMVQEQSHIGCLLLPDHHYQFIVLQPERVDVRYFNEDLKWFLKAFRWFQYFAPITGKTMRINTSDLTPLYSNPDERKAMLHTVKEWGIQVKTIIENSRKSMKKPEPIPKEKPVVNPKAKPEPIPKAKPEPKPALYTLEKTDVKKVIHEGQGYATEWKVVGANFEIHNPVSPKDPFIITPANALIANPFREIASGQITLERLVMLPKFQKTPEPALVLETKTTGVPKKTQLWVYHVKKNKKDEFMYVLIPKIAMRVRS